jgi:spermidine synthase
MLPVLIQSNPVASTFLLGYGSGTTAGATLASPSVKRLTIAELEEAVVAADKFFNQSNGSPLREEWKRSGRVRMLVADGRSILTGSRDKFDVIISQPGDAWVNGMTDLFTREFWSVAASRLKPGGLMAQWIQLYSITPEYLGILLRTFRDAFPYSLMFHPPGSGELILVGSREPVEIDVKKLAARIKEPEVARILSETGVRTSADILAMLVKGAPEFSAFCDQLARDSGDNRLNTDDNLLTEYQLPRQLFSTPGILPANIKAIQGRDLDMLAALKNYGETASEKAQTLSALALAFARLAADPDLKLFYEKQALRLAEQATALDFSPATLQAKAQVKEMLGRGDKRGQSR